MKKRREVYCMPRWIYEKTDEVIKMLPHPYGTFKKARYVVYTYCQVSLYSCVTTCRSEENMLELLMEWVENNCYMKEYDFARIVKYQGEEEKTLFKGNVFK